MSLRLTGGALRGLRLKTPRGTAVRPTASRVREGLFSILGQCLDGIAVLDLFAGAGTLGLEAGSRGAGSVVFVEASKKHVSVLDENVKLLADCSSVRVLKMDVLKAIPSLAREGGRFDLVFLDPPYGKGLGRAALEALKPVADRLLEEASTVVVESDGKEALPPHVGDWTLKDRRRYGRTHLSFYTDRRTEP